MEKRQPPVTFDSSPAEGVINFGIGQPSPDLLPVDLLREVAADCLSNARPLDMNYGERKGDAGFRTALADFLSSHYHHQADPESLIVTGGNSQALDFVCGQFARHGDTVFIEEPSYFLAHQIFADHGLQVVGIPMDQHGLCMDTLREQLRHHAPALLYTIPSYQNPCGTTLSGERRNELLHLSREHGFVIVADEVYQLLNYTEEPPPAFGTMIDDANILSLGSFSKIMAPALRLGWIQATPALMDRILATGVVNSGGSFNHFTSLIMRQALASGRQAELLDSVRSAYNARLKVMDEALHEHFVGLARWNRPKGGYFFWLEMDKDVNAALLKPRAADYGTGFQPGELFSCDGGFSNFLRLSFAHYTEGEIREGIARLGVLLRENPAIS